MIYRYVEYCLESDSDCFVVKMAHLKTNVLLETECKVGHFDNAKVSSAVLNHPSRCITDCYTLNHPSRCITDCYTICLHAVGEVQGPCASDGSSCVPRTHTDNAATSGGHRHLSVRHRYTFMGPQFPTCLFYCHLLGVYA